MRSVESKMTGRICENDRGWCFTPKSFFGLGSSQAIRITLHRLEKRGTIRRLAHGLYDYPKKHPSIGILSPDPNEIARALSVRDSTRIQPSGAYAANLLGLTEQVPAKIIFLTDGPERRVRIRSQEIILKRTTPRYMATAGKISGTVIQALRHIGEANIAQSGIKRLRKMLKDKDRVQLKRDKRHAPAWMHHLIDSITGSADA
ncbi:MAG: hypothetical protein A3G34_10960 [Candidatus Lindowbacteria bacterium RIFCSPLOWO2_12_FULL_62_27]|nr:MAG: hypothetical protein A3I06_12045 [Candidatus Lindowbacteria bacterium RIFCSPLOWO2_02_FULL_62_12]OGH60638.1 MAG: hypothetical protein A3G34_10960 [Candidatus Lindowbacteria bacterium RIFCSPLOWO2_12_FULL_62_27]